MGRFTTVTFNAGEAVALVGGVADELDWRNVDWRRTRRSTSTGFWPGRAARGDDGQRHWADVHRDRSRDRSPVRVAALRRFGLVGISPVTGLPYGIYAGLDARGARRTGAAALAEHSGSPATRSGPGTVYALKHTPILVAPVTQAGNGSVANPFVAPQGTISTGTTAVATFTVSPDGTAVTTLSATPYYAAVGGFLDPTARW